MPALLRPCAGEAFSELLLPLLPYTTLPLLPRFKSPRGVIEPVFSRTAAPIRVPEKFLWMPNCEHEVRERHDAARDVESLDHFKPPRTGFRV